MSRLRFILGEMRNEFVAGITNGVALLIFVILTGYIGLMLSSAGYVANMSGADVQRNAASLVYMFSTGDSFFLFFAWAWLFAQPIMRDRAASLHENVFTAPISLRALLMARYFGALGVAVVVGGSQVVGFMLAPLLEVAGIVPPGSMGPTPWAALAWGWLIFIVPTAAGSGALYFIAAMRTRSTAGPFAISAAQILFWMIAIIVLGEAGISPMLQTIIDPSCFTAVERSVSEWTPLEKATMLYPVTSALLWNRVVWVGLPLLLLGIAILRATRERLVLEREAKKRADTRSSGTRSMPLPPAIAETSWVGAMFSEIRWQVARLAESRAFWAVVLGLVGFGFIATFYHMVAHADGPFVPRPENTPPLLTTVLFVFLLFIAAALAGFIMRRDDRPGFSEMMDATPAPDYVRLVGRCVTILFLTLVLGLIPAASAILAGFAVAPQHASFATPIIHQLVDATPALLEMAAISILAHALIRKSGVAYAASMLGAWAALVNNETAMVEYPPFQYAVVPNLPLSGLTGWGIWAERLLLIDLFKFATVVAIMAVAGLLMVRGVDSRLAHGARQIRQRFAGPILVVLIASLVGAAVAYDRMGTRYAEGGYRSSSDQKVAAAARERRWLANAGRYATAGGEVWIAVDPALQRVRGRWLLRQVRSDDGRLDLELPHGLGLAEVRVEGRAVRPAVAHDHAAVPLGACAATGCTLELHWTVDARGWIVDHIETIMAEAKREPASASRHGVWLTADRVMPRLGFDTDDLLSAPADRAQAGLAPEPSLPLRNARAAATGVAPAGDWRWSVAINGTAAQRGTTDGPLDFAAVWAPGAKVTRIGDISYASDPSRADLLPGLAADVASMRACVERRLGASAPLRAVAQLPRGLGESRMHGSTLLLAEEPHWDIAGTGAGRWQRQATIAELLAAARIAAGSDARRGDGANWLTAGVGGAIGLLCSADLNGIAALHRLVERGAERTTTALAANASPIRSLADAGDAAWVAEYAPLAALGWVARAKPEELAALIVRVRESGDVGQALQAVAGGARAAELLGPPQQSDLSVRRSDGRLTVERERWLNGRWVPAQGRASVLEYSARPVQARPVALGQRVGATGGVLYLDDRAAYERSVIDNGFRKRS